MVLYPYIQARKSSSSVEGSINQPTAFTEQNKPKGNQGSAPMKRVKRQKTKQAKREAEEGDTISVRAGNDKGSEELFSLPQINGLKEELAM